MATTGGINIGATGNGIESASTLADLQKLYERRGFAHQLMSAAEVNARWPQFALSDDLHALYQPDYGVLFASASGPAPGPALGPAPGPAPRLPSQMAQLGPWGADLSHPYV